MERFDWSDSFAVGRYMLMGRVGVWVYGNPLQDSGFLAVVIDLITHVSHSRFT